MSRSMKSTMVMNTRPMSKAVADHNHFHATYYQHSMRRLTHHDVYHHGIGYAVGTIIFVTNTRIKGGRKNFGPGTAKSHFERPGSNINGTIKSLAKKGFDQWGKPFGTPTEPKKRTSKKKESL